jgi:hypothetical protein
MAVYIVGGLNRSGRSMMMQAIAASSTLTPYYDTDYETKVRAAVINPASYDPNPGGFWHYDPQKTTDNWLSNLDGYVTKADGRDIINNMPIGPVYYVVYMTRSLAQIQASYNAAFGRNIDLLTIDINYQAYMSLLNRSDINLITLNYPTVVSSPTTEFQKLIDAGWPINLSQAVAIVDSNLYRHTQ